MPVSFPEGMVSCMQGRESRILPCHNKAFRLGCKQKNLSDLAEEAKCVMKSS